jgi:hypothetical protein
MTAPQSSVPKTASPPEGWIALPPDLVRRLGAFRRRVRRIKLFEAACAALCGVAVGFLALFLLDRVSDTPAWARGLLFTAAIVACGAIPWAWHRWVWRQRSLEQVARLIERRFPAVGDELRGIIDIVRGGGAGESKSRTLCEAAVAQGRDIRSGVDQHRRHQIQGVGGMGAAGLGIAHQLAIAVIGGDQHCTARSLDRGRDTSQTRIDRLDRFDGCTHRPTGSSRGL